MDAPVTTTDLVAKLAADPRVLGVARLAAQDGRVRILVATTWDGLEPLGVALPELAATAVALEYAVVRHAVARIDVLTPDGTRLAIELERMSEMVPGPRGLDAVVLHDPQGVLAQWVEWSHNRKVPQADEAAIRAALAARALAVDDGLRAFESFPRGAVLVREHGAQHPIRHRLGNLIRERAAALPAAGTDGGAAAVEALRARAADVLASVPPPGAGLREHGDGALERFLAVADAEGFAGDRVLFSAAADRLAALSGRTPTFEEGFCLPSFDQVEGRFSLGDAVGGCQPPLVPGVYVGIGVTPTDALEFWAAPCVAEPVATLACVADGGERTVVPRAAGRDALLGALTTAVDEAHDALAEFLRGARAAGKQALDDPVTALRALHLARSHVAAAAEHGATAAGVTRLMAALALTRAGEDAEPVVARKLGLAAGRLLARTTPADSRA